jgi:hypothetical protein
MAQKTYIPTSPLKHSKLSIGDIVVLNRDAIEYLYVGKYNIVNNKEFGFQEPRDFLLLKIKVSKSLAHLTKPKSAGPKNQFRQNAKEICYFIEQLEIADYFLSYDKEIREAFKLDEGLFVPIKDTESISNTEGHPTPVNMLQTQLSEFFAETNTPHRKKDIYPAYINVGATIFASGGYLCLSEYKYTNSFPESLRGKILYIWRKNKELDLSERKGQQERRFNPQSALPFKTLESVKMGDIIQTPLPMYIACVEWYGHPHSFLMNIPLYVIMPYDIIKKDTS